MKEQLKTALNDALALPTQDLVALLDAKERQIVSDCLQRNGIPVEVAKFLVNLNARVRKMERVSERPK